MVTQTGIKIAPSQRPPQTWQPIDIAIILAKIIIL